MFVIFSCCAKSQVGINTANPQGILSVDGLKITHPQEYLPQLRLKDDLMMSPNGNLGLVQLLPNIGCERAITNR